MSLAAPWARARHLAVRAGLVALAGLAFCAAAHAEPAIIFELGGKQDKSFGQSAWEGAERWKLETGQPYAEFEIANAAQREQAARRFAERGADPIVAVGFPQASSIATVARDFPQRHFAIVDAVVLRPNVQSFVYREHEGAFLAGLLAALASKTGAVGFVGGQDIPLVRKVMCGYQQGAKYGNPRIRLLSAMTGTTNAAWTDPARGAELARTQAAEGADVIFAAAGTTGLGVLQAMADLGLLGIGVDSNQNELHPGHMLTSMIKHTDVAVYRAFKGVQPGVTTLGLREGGLELAFDNENAALVTPTMRARVDAARTAIIDGSLRVIDSTVTGTCH
jgi:basic membrane protein A